MLYAVGVCHFPQTVIDGGLSRTVDDKPFPGPVLRLHRRNTIGNILLPDDETVLYLPLSPLEAIGPLMGLVFDLGNAILYRLAGRLLFLPLFPSYFLFSWRPRGFGAVSSTEVLLFRLFF